MKAILCEAFGPVASLRVGNAPDRAPSIGEVAIRVVAAGVNFPDGLMVEGRYQTKPALPFTPGSEVAGVIEAAGEGVSGLAPGERVAAFTGTGGFAERAIVPATQAYPLPDAIGFETAAGALVTYGTSFHALRDRATLGSGETLLVLGAAGGVGLAAVELGRTMGARVIAVASSEEKRALCRERGADSAIDYADLRAQVNELTGGRGADVVYDPVGGEPALAAIKALAWGGRHLIVGFAGGDIPRIPANLLLLKSAASLGVLWGASVKRDPERHAANIADLLGWIAEGRLRPRIDATYPLDRTADALAHVMERRAQGKVVVRIA
ncbi:MAG TPA: NADPH:quinone oxidoreductase family protein [Sphingomonas sp.]|nr:NADPH:quinone oxidoreductase family protein [Sphingomonas sp.]